MDVQDIWENASEGIRWQVRSETSRLMSLVFSVLLSSGKYHEQIYASNRTWIGIKRCTVLASILRDRIDGVRVRVQVSECALWRKKKWRRVHLRETAPWAVEAGKSWVCRVSQWAGDQACKNPCSVWELYTGKILSSLGLYCLKALHWLDEAHIIASC